MDTSSASKHAGAQRLFILVVGSWVGSLLTTGYLVAPTIFNTLTDRQVAGMVAGSIFRVEALLSTLVCIALMVLANLLVNRGLAQYRLIRWILLAMLLCSLSASFILIPWMNTLRDEALLQGMPVLLSPSASIFSKLHGASNIIFLIQSLLGVYLLWRLTQNIK
jgi:Domain of unknown function (DUF4149)